VNTEATIAVLGEVMQERAKQDRKWGEQNHHPPFWSMILGEEVGEANKAGLEMVVCEMRDAPQESVEFWRGEYRKELVQVAAVAVAMIECIDRSVVQN
jgi:hypothetical protein